MASVSLPGGNPPASSNVREEDLVSALQRRISEVDVGKFIWRAANLGSADTLELILKLPYAKKGINYVPESSPYNPLMVAAKKGSLECIKLLLYYGADLFYKFSNVFFKNMKVWHVAKREHHLIVERYLRNCVEDFQKCGTSRAYLELSIKRIASSTNCSRSDIVNFFECLRKLVKYCGFDVNDTSDEENVKYQPLLLRAASASNLIVVTKLLEEFKADHEIRDPLTGENLLHICFKKASSLRFYFTVEYPSLLHQSDNSGDLPLFIACRQSDYEFFYWLFGKAKPTDISSSTSELIESELPKNLINNPSTKNREKRSQTLLVASESVDIIISSLEACSSQNDNSDPEIPITPIPMELSPKDKTPSDEEETDSTFSDDEDASNYEIFQEMPTIAEVVKMQPFRAGEDGNSILHILAEQGLAEILAIFLKVCSYTEDFDFSALCVRRGNNLPLPIEKALTANHLACTRVLIELTIYSNQLPVLLQDKHILKVATVTTNIENVKILIRFGFYTGIKLAISLAANYKKYDILRLLLFWQAQIQSYLDSSQSKRIHRSHDANKLQWQQLELQYINPIWLFDAVNATSITTEMFAKLKSMSQSVKEQNYTFFEDVGLKCLQYFEDISRTMSTIPPLLKCSECAKIVDINLSENHLERVPAELFQLSSLTNLTLKYNEIKYLPTSEDLASNLYSAKLETLSLDYNDLTSLPDDMIWGLAKSLTILSVQNNKLEDIPPGLWVMPKLTTIKFAQNHLSSLHYLSKADCYENKELMKQISTFGISENGVLKHKGDDEYSDEVCKAVIHIKRLAALLRTIYTAFFPDEDITAERLLRQVIQIYSSKLLDIEADRWDSTPTPDHDLSQLTVHVHLFSEENSAIFASKLKYLDLSHNNFKTVPWDLPCLAPNLINLDMSTNLIAAIDIVHDLPKAINNLSITHNKIASLCQIRPTQFPCANPIKLLSLSNKKDASSYCKHCSHKILKALTRLNLDNNLIDYFPVLKRLRTESNMNLEGSGAPFQSNPLYPDLAILSLANNKLISVPQHIHYVKHLNSLNLSFNNITELPEEMGLLNTDFITLIKLDGIVPRNVPQNVLKSSARELVKYLKDLKLRSKPYRHMKLMLVGESNKGKTSLLLNLTRRGKMTHYKKVGMDFRNMKPLSTVGVDLGEYEYSPHATKPPITFMTWDFGGQEEYYATHQCFLTKRSLYLLLWDIKDGEEGLKSLQPWLENIGSCAPYSPVIVIGTHLDQISPGSTRERERIICDLQEKFNELYASYNEYSFAYPRIMDKCYFVDVYNSKHMDVLRDDIYFLVANFKLKEARKFYTIGGKALLDELIPESYIVLQDFIKKLAEKCRAEGLQPVYTKAALMEELSKEGYYYENDLEQVASFLHENGILLNYDDRSFLSDLYFIDPQWLCKMLAKIITIRNTNPHYKKGFMWMKHVQKIYSSYCDEFIDLLRKFEVVYKLDDKRILIPSFLPESEEDACIIYSSTVSNSLAESDDLIYLDPEGYMSLCQLNFKIFCRYYLLPFVPNGFFTRLIARLMSSNIINQLYNSLVRDPLESLHVANTIHWRCWRNGITIVWNHKEIFRVAPLTDEKPTDSKVVLITKSHSQELMNSLTGIEIKVAIIPESKIRICTFLEPALNRMSEGGARKFKCEGVNFYLENSSKAQCIASWLLHRATSILDSVFNDWYEGFAQKKECPNLKMTNYCSKCVTSVYNSPQSMKTSRLFMYTSTYCCLAASKGEYLKCPNHGLLKVEDVAPDLIFCDFHPANVFTDTSGYDLKILFPVGTGAFGTVYKATLQKKPLEKFEQVNVALKKVKASNCIYCGDKDMNDQLKAWDMYHRASLEARVMNKLYHKHVLGLIGLCYWPQLSILIEFAPKGDLKTVLEDYKSEGIRLSRRTIKTTLIQLADALNYLHSLNIIYRDLKPQNILVWKYPEPKSQWNNNALIHIKIADYGISSEISPQGIRGYEGTEPYLPPEVIIFGGKKVYSTQIDVYAFGMCIYYLVALQSPFKDSHVVVALKEGKRPELPIKLLPHSVFIMELMCWCWSDLPQHRPNFSQILQVLRSETFTNLVASAQAMESNTQITAACLHNVIANPIKNSTQKAMCPSIARIMSVIHGKSSHENETALQVWYGTENGRCEMMQFQPSGTIKKNISIPSKVKEYIISSIKIIAGRVWISTVGCGLFVYNAHTFQYECSWGDSEKQNVYMLLDVGEFNTVLALTSNGIYSFNSDINATKLLFDSLEPQGCKNIESIGQSINVGVVIPLQASTAMCEVWVCSHTEHHFYIVSPVHLNVTEEVEFTEKEMDLLMESRRTEEQKLRLTSVSKKKQSGTTMTTNIKNLHVIQVNYLVKLAIANNYILLLCDAEKRELEQIFNCKDYLKEYYEDHIPANATRIMSLQSKEEVLYLGLEGGIILSINCYDMSVLLAVHAYDRAVSSLMLLRQGRYSRISQPTSNICHSISYHATVAKQLPPTSLPLNNTAAFKRKRFQSAHGPEMPGVFNTQSLHRTVVENTVLLSIGRAYRSVVGSESNYPPEFILPSVHANQTITEPVKPGVSTSHLLIWSTESKIDGKTLENEQIMFDALEDTT